MRTKHWGGYATFLALGVLLLAACGSPGGKRGPDPADGVGLVAQYFSNPDLSGPSADQIDAKMVFSWGQAAPRSGVRPQEWSARWSGFLKPEFSEEYTFYLNAEGQATLWVGGAQVAEGAPVHLEAGVKVPVQIEFRKTLPDAASLRLEWASPRQKREVVPQGRLYPLNAEGQGVSAMAVPTGQNLLNNPGFEAGTGGWNQYGGTFAVISPGRSGSGKAAKVQGSWVEQPLPYSSTQGGATYTLEAWGRSLSGAGCKVGFLGGRSGALTFNVNLSFTSATWSRKSLNQTTPADTVWVVVYLEDSGGECQFDDLSLMVGGGTNPAPVINSFTATPSALPAGGGATTLAWNVSGATSLLIDGGVGAVSGASGSISTTATLSKTFTLTASNGGGSVSRSVSVAVAGATVPNLLTNGDFEMGLAGWNSYGSSSLVSPGHGGNNALRTTSAWVEQPLTPDKVKAGVNYALSGWGRSLGGSCKLGMLGGNPSTVLFDRNFSFFGDWSQLSATQTLPAGTTWLVVYTDTSGTCEFDDLVLSNSATASVPPANPANFQSTGATANSIGLSWSAAAGASYTLERKSGSAAYAQIAAPTGTSYTDTGLSASTAYSYRLKAVANGLSSTGTELSVSTSGAPTLPSNPTSFTASATAPTSVSLSWTAVGNATGYSLDRRTYTGGYSLLVGSLTATAYTDTSASPDTFYFYRVRASNASGSSTGLEAGTTTPPSGPNGGANAASKGYFAPPIDWPLVPTFGGLMPSGKILTWYGRDRDGSTRDADYNDQAKHGSTIGDLWDPVSGSHTQVDNTHTDLFCAGHALTPDGRFFVAGGNLGSQGGYYPGSRHTNLFDPASGTWSNGPDMAEGRWYPTVITLGNGEMLVVGGNSNNNPADTNTVFNRIPDVYNPSTGTLRRLTGASTNLVNSFEHFYPWLHVAPNGLVFYAGASSTMAYLNPAGVGSWSGSTFRDSFYRNYGSSVEYDTGKLLVLGGGYPATATAVTVNLNGGGAAVATTASLNRARTHVNATSLPDGRVFVNGGDTDGANFDITNAVYESEIWSPSTGQWTLGAVAQKPRIYHSMSVLLPDGRVLTAGGGGCGGCAVNQFNAELYYPPYLFKSDGSLAARPTIVNAPQTLSYGGSFTLETAQPASRMARVTLNKLGAATHAFNMGQHFVPLSFSTSGTNTLSVSAPSSSNIAPPGYYLLFVLDASGVPSAAKFVKVQ